MPLSQVKFYDSGNNELASPLIFTGAEAGQASAAQEVRIINAKDADSGVVLTNARLAALARLKSVGGDFKAAGVNAVDRDWVEVKVTGGVNKSIVAGQWTRIGLGRALSLPTLGVDEGVILSVRISPPMPLSPQDVEVKLGVSNQAATPVPFDMGAAGLGGVVLGLGDNGSTEHLVANDVIQNPAGADNQVDVQEQVWIAAGKPFRTTGLVTIAASTSTFERFVLLSLAADGTVTQTDSTEVASGTLTESDKPSVPVGELALAYVTRDDTALIQDADIENVHEVGAYRPYAGTGVTVRVGPGQAVVGASIVEHTGTTDLSAPTSATSYLWLLEVGVFQWTSTADPPADDSLLLAEVETDAVTILSLVDHRRFTGGELVPVTFQWDGTVAAADVRFAVNPLGRRAHVLPIRGLIAAVGAIGDRTTGQIAWSLAADDGGFTDLTDAATEPALAFDATELVATSAPKTFVVEPYARLRATIDEIPTTGGAADPSDATLTVWLMGA